MRPNSPLSQHTSEKHVCGANLKSARGVVLCQHHPALTRESLLPVHETRVNKKNHSVFQNCPFRGGEHHELHHIEFDFASGEYHIQPVASSDSVTATDFPVLCHRVLFWFLSSWIKWLACSLLVLVDLG